MRLFEELARRIAVTLIALSLILAGNSNTLIGHSEAASTSCNEISQAAAKSESQVFKAAADAAFTSVIVKAGDFLAGSTGKSSVPALQGCCSLYCSPAAAISPQPGTLNPPSARVAWEILSQFLSAVPQGGLKRPPRQSGTI